MFMVGEIVKPSGTGRTVGWGRTFAARSRTFAPV